MNDILQGLEKLSEPMNVQTLSGYGWPSRSGALKQRRHLLHAMRPKLLGQYPIHEGHRCF